jgi:hypothetical protein
MVLFLVPYFKISSAHKGCFRKKASMSMAKQKAPNARRAIVEQ